jgi:phosphopantothenoylcysteine decarboxylase/phosphopantothenate--cysteine ligase
VSLNNKRVLITAGPTWVSRDSVRVISNIATGETGILLAKRLSLAGAKVTLALGPSCCADASGKIKIIRFKFFEELKEILAKELRSQAYDAVIHSAAVSDFKPARHIRGKLKSDSPFTLRLAALPKLVATIKRISPYVKLVMFKLESGLSDHELIRRAREAMCKSNADAIVANRIKPKYRAYILDKEKVYAKVDSKKDLAGKLTGVLGGLWN